MTEADSTGLEPRTYKTLNEIGFWNISKIKNLLFDKNSFEMGKKGKKEPIQIQNFVQFGKKANFRIYFKISNAHFEAIFQQNIKKNEFSIETSWF